MTECVEWHGSRNEDGYGNKWFAGKCWKVHRLAWTLCMGSIPEGLNVLHRCDNPPCYAIDHLFLGTQLENIADRNAKGRTALHPGELCGKAKLTWDQVHEIRERYAAGGVTQRALGNEYGVVNQLISQIVNNRIWVV